MTEPRAARTSAEIIRRTYARLPEPTAEAAPEPDAAAEERLRGIIDRTYARTQAPPDDDETEDAADEPKAAARGSPEAPDHSGAGSAATPTREDPAERTPSAADDGVKKDVELDMASADAAGPDDTGDARLLRALAGPHVGAELTLHPGRYEIGTDENCDIVLSDSQVAARHALLTVSADGIAIEPGDGIVTVGDASIDGRVALDDFVPVRMGSTVFAFGPAGAPWPEIDLPRPEPEPPQGDHDEKDGADSADQPTDAAPTATEDLATTTTEPPTSVAASGRAIDRVRQLPWRIVAVAAAGLALLVAVVALGVHLWQTSNEAVMADPAAAANPLGQVRAIVDELGLSDRLTVDQATGEGNDRVVVQGYVATEDQRRELLDALDPLISKIDVRVWSTELLQESLRAVLAGMRLELTVTSVENGKVVLSGLLPSSISEDGLKQALQRDVPGIATIDLQVVSVAEAAQWLRERISQVGIPDQALSITQDGSSFVVEGRLPARWQGAWHDTASTFAQRYGPQLTLQDEVTFAPAQPREDRAPTAKSLDLVVRAINLGPPAYITLDSNEKYLVGSRLSNGMILDEIRPDGLVLRDGDTRHLVEVAEGSGRVARVRQLETE